jgi:hypothetical protein
MAAALAHQPARILGPTSNLASMADSAVEVPQHETEVVAHFGDMQRALASVEGMKKPREEVLGVHSKGLSVDDFELVKTLGTGMCSAYCTFIRRNRRRPQRSMCVEYSG